jgi:2-C-methyl-D-erythritol 4-phosphate cytidylyltransferase/2-C-methyl-D-erythritol 2,4-cyclodiphosphate synthase
MNSAVIVAAGKSMRYHMSGGYGSKIDINLKGKPLFYHSVRVFLSMGFEVILVHNNPNLKIPNVKVVKGGETRSESVYNGVKETSGKYIFIHDAARPLLTKGMIGKLLNEKEYGDGCYLAKWVTDSLKQITKGDKVLSIDRDMHFTSETPQVFKRDILLEAFSKAEKSYTDEVAMVEDIFPNSELYPIFHKWSNDKLTEKEDLSRIERLLGIRRRIGHSFDIHKLEKGRKLILGGVEIPSEVGLLGHSDADVVLHAVTESILGALGLGDLGTNFPDTSCEYKGISSVILLEKVLDEMRKRNFDIGNIDISLYLEKPKLFKFRHEILYNLRKLLNVHDDVINFKVTTTEKIGPIGQSEAIACEAVVILEEVYEGDS